MLFLLYQKPYDLKQNRQSKKSPNIEMVDVVNYSIEADGVGHILRASRVLRFTTYDEFYDLDSARKSKDMLFENLKADRAIFVRDDLKLSGDVRYSNSDTLQFSSKEASYNFKTGVFKTDVSFELKDSRSLTKGSSMQYGTKEGRIYAKQINSLIKEKKK